MTEVKVIIQYEEFWDDGECETCGGGGSSSGFQINIDGKEYEELRADPTPGCFGGPHYTYEDLSNYLNEILQQNNMTIKEIYFD